jgi:hydroxymethylpyrimidine pyrophosphatase-like HAD family hydrolase
MGSRRVSDRRHNGGRDIEVTAAGVDKGDALRRLCEYFIVAAESVIVCGDSGNDLSMRGYCGLFVAPDNASKPILEVADVITNGVEKDGVAEWLLTNLTRFAER